MIPVIRDPSWQNHDLDGTRREETAIVVPSKQGRGGPDYVILE